MGPEPPPRYHAGMVRHALAIALSLIIFVATARAEITVVVLEQIGQEPRHTFVQALRIPQSCADGTVVCNGACP